MMDAVMGETASSIISTLFLAILFVVGVAIARLRNLFAIVMLTGVYSLVSAAWYILVDAVDVGFTEAAVGAGRMDDTVDTIQECRKFSFTAAIDVANGCSYALRHGAVIRRGKPHRGHLMARSRQGAAGEVAKEAHAPDHDRHQLFLAELQAKIVNAFHVL